MDFRGRIADTIVRRFAEKHHAVAPVQTGQIEFGWRDGGLNAALEPA
jgi:hypothetical protein